MNKITRVCAAIFAAIFIASLALASAADARGRKGSHRAYSGHGKGSHYVGGH